MTPAIIAHYLVAIAVIAVFLTIALIREALIREAADRRAGAPVELPEDWDRLADCQKVIRIDDLEKVAKRIERRAAFAARYGCEVKA